MAPARALTQASGEIPCVLGKETCYHVGPDPGWSHRMRVCQRTGKSWRTIPAR